MNKMRDHMFITTQTNMRIRCFRLLVVVIVVEFFL